MSRVQLSDKRYTLHSIRKSAATTAFEGGRSELEIKHFGGWSSDAHRTYINIKHTHRVNKTLVQALAATGAPCFPTPLTAKK